MPNACKHPPQRESVGLEQKEWEVVNPYRQGQVLEELVVRQILAFLDARPVLAAPLALQKLAAHKATVADRRLIDGNGLIYHKK